jgi:RecB family endonuclease NucS
MNTMNSKVVEVVVKVIQEEKIKSEIGWVEGWCLEEAVSTFLIKNPDLIKRGAKLVSMQVENRLTRFDLLFRKEKTYFVVEVKRRRPATNALKRKVTKYAYLFEQLIIQENQECESIVPVLVTTQ